MLDQLGNMQHALQILSWPARAGQNFLKNGLRPRATPECSLALALRALRARPCAMWYCNTTILIVWAVRGVVRLIV